MRLFSMFQCRWGPRQAQQASAISSCFNQSTISWIHYHQSNEAIRLLSCWLSVNERARTRTGTGKPARTRTRTSENENERERENPRERGNRRERDRASMYRRLANGERVANSSWPMHRLVPEQPSSSLMEGHDRFRGLETRMNLSETIQSEWIRYIRVMKTLT
jgi:hypothetical protein